jgi:DNA-binding LacI/PurR family transcriptional regulator
MATTLRDVAKLAEASVSAVAAVMNENSAHNVRVGATTRQRILAAANTLSYRPNAIARSLRERRTNIIGLYAGYGEIYTLDPFLSELIFGMQKGCEAVAKDLLLHGNFRGRPSDEIHAELLNGKIDGLVLFSPVDDPLVGRLIESDLPVVAVADAVPGLPSVVVDDAAGSRMMAEYLAAKGHTRVLYRTSAMGKTSVQARLAGFLAAAEMTGLTILHVEETDWKGELSALEKDWLSGRPGERPTALVCWNDGVAYTTLEECLALGLRVPDDVAVTGFDGFRWPIKPAHRLTTIHAPWAEVARTAVSLLACRLAGERIPAETVLPVEMVVGETG